MAMMGCVDLPHRQGYTKTPMVRNTVKDADLFAAAMADVAAEGQTVQLMLSPVNLPEGKGAYSFRMPQSTAVMAIPIVEHWKKTGVKTYGFLGYSDAYGEAWLKDQPAFIDRLTKWFSRFNGQREKSALAFTVRGAILCCEQRLR